SARYSARRCWPTPWPGRPPPRPRAPPRIAPARAVSSRWPAQTPISAWCRPVPAKPPGPSRKATATAAGGLFFPPSKDLGIGQAETSPAVQQRITYAGTVSRSFAEGSDLLARLADTAVSAKQVERVTRRIGAERVAARDTQVAAYQALPLVEKFGVPPGGTPPDLAVVMADGGRLQIWDRTAPPAAAPPPPAEGSNGGRPPPGRGQKGRGPRGGRGRALGRGESSGRSLARGQGGAAADHAQRGRCHRPVPGHPAVVPGRQPHPRPGAGAVATRQGAGGGRGGG